MELNEGEVICPDCNGEKKIADPKLNYYVFWIKCPKCKGAGKLDWIENIVGKQNPINFKISSLFGTQPLKNNVGSIFKLGSIS